jgi:hypothetical protein
MEIGKLSVSLVIIEMPDCESFCKVFQELGVPHVISFSTKNYNTQIFSKVLQQRISKQKAYSQVIRFMHEFCNNLYRELFNNKSIYKAVEESELKTKTS